MKLTLVCLVLVFDIHAFLAETCIDLVAKLEELDQKYDQLLATVNELTSAPAEPVVLVKAKLKSNTNVTNYNTVVYDKVMFSEGNQYNSSTGVFTASDTGIYTFAVQSCSYEHKWDRLTLKKDGVEIGSILSGDSGWAECNTEVTTTILDAGSKVWVERLRGLSTTGLLQHYSSFSAVLIRTTQGPIGQA